MEETKSDIVVTYSDRGFARYGEAFPTDYGHILNVYESSSAMEHCVWLNIDASQVEERYRQGNGIGQASVHLTREQARALRDRLDIFLSTPIPGRFNYSPEVQFLIDMIKEGNRG